MSVKTDSSIGLIISKKVRLPATYENEKGILNFPDSYLVVEREAEGNGLFAKRPDFTYVGDLYFLVENESGKTSIKISIVKIETLNRINQDGKTYNNNYHYYDPTPQPIVKTTGVFEKLIFDNIK
jgi:archaellin